MPILPPNPTNPYDTVEAALNLARVRLNDAIQSLGGDVLKDDAPFTQTIVNGAWRRFQQYLVNLGYNRLVSEVVLTGLPAVTQASADPAIQVWLNWSQYFDGQDYFAPPATPVLPQDLIQPLRLWERQSGQNSPFAHMDFRVDGLPNCAKGQYNYIWEWRDNAIFMPGSKRVMDLRIRYLAYLPDFVVQGNVPWYQQPMGIMYCLDAMADYIAFEVAKARGDQGADDFLRRAETEAQLVFNRDISMKQRTNVRRRPYGYGR